MSNVVRFPIQKPANPNGEVYIYPCALDGGSWAVEHRSRSGDSAAFLGAFLGLDEAIAAARKWAATMGADFDQGRSAAATDDEKTVAALEDEHLHPQEGFPDAS